MSINGSTLDNQHSSHAISFTDSKLITTTTTLAIVNSPSLPHTHTLSLKQGCTNKPQQGMVSTYRVCKPNAYRQ